MLKNKIIHNLIIDEEFSRLTAPLSPTEYSTLEQMILSHGCNTPIVSWNRLIIEGFSEYKLCHQHKIAFHIKEVSFASRCEAIIKITSKTIQQKNISDEQYRYCVGKLYDASKAQMELLYPHQNQYTPDSQRRPGYEKNRQTTSQLLGKKLHLSDGSVSKYGVYARAMDSIFEKVPSIGQEILAGKFHISHDNTIELSKLSREEIIVIHKHAAINNDTRLLYSLTQRNRQSEKEYARKDNKKRFQKEPEIKQMPLYDPDAEISSLTLTIPTWISSINRTMSIANLSQATTQGLWKLEQQLNFLSDTIIKLKKNIQETSYEKSTIN